MTKTEYSQLLHKQELVRILYKITVPLVVQSASKKNAFDQ